MSVQHGENADFEYKLSERLDAARTLCDREGIRIDADEPSHVAAARQLTALWVFEQMKSRSVGPAPKIRGDTAEELFVQRATTKVAMLWKGPLGESTSRGTERGDTNATFAQNALLADLGITIEIPHENNDELVMATPTRSVDPAKAEYVRRVVDSSGKAEHFRPGTTQRLPLMGLTRGETKGRLHYMWAGQADGWIDGLTERYAYADDASIKLRALNRAFEDGYRDALTTREGNLDYIAFNTLTPLVSSGTSVIGSTAFDTLKAELVLLFSGLNEATVGTAIRGTAVVSDRILSRLLGYGNFAAGGTAEGNARRAFAEVLAEYGVSNIIKGKALYNEGGTKVDGMWLMNTGDDTGLRRVMALAPAPLHSYTDQEGTKTVWVSKHGGLDLPLQDRVAHMFWSVS